jgi:hypothetical protein
MLSLALETSMPINHQLPVQKGLALGRKVTQKIVCFQAMVAHAYNLSYSGGRDQEDQSLRPAWANSS